jgi:tetratricopeptide (TPR) repeat protein
MLRWMLPLGALVALTLASYAPVLEAGFVEFDDTGYVADNPPVASGLELASLRWALTGYHLSNWHPLTWISHMADVELYGLEPGGHHATSLALHLVNGVLLFLLLRALTRDELPSLLVAAVFALHPVNVESVAWIAQRKTLLSTAFGILAIAAYARYARGGGRRAYLASLLGLALSLTSKQMFVTLPVLLLLLDYWPLRRAELETARIRLLAEKLPHLLLAVAAAGIALHSQQDAMAPIDVHPLSIRLANAAVAYVRYVGMFFAPSRLAVFYPLDPQDLTALRAGACLALLVAITAAACALGRRHRHLAVGWLWFVVSLVPVIGVVQVGMQSHADRYAYVPFWGLALVVVWSGAELMRRRPSAAVRALAGVVLLVVSYRFCVLTSRQASAWHDSIRLFEHAVANTERNWLAHGFLASRYFARGEYPTAIEHCEVALPWGRDLGSLRSTYGLALYETGSPERALEQFRLAAQQAPDDPVGFMNLGWLLSLRGEHDLALVQLSDAADKLRKTTPPYTRMMVFANWANALASTAQLPEAREKYGLALAIRPDSPLLLRDAARVDVQLGDPARAAARLRRVLEIDPQDDEALYLLASATALEGDAPAAEALFRRALARAPGSVGVSAELGRTLARLGRADEASRLLRALLELPAPGADARFVRATLLASLGEIALERGDVTGAIRELEGSLAAHPESYDANNRLAFLLATSADPRVRDPARAVALAERATAARREYGSLATLAAAHASAGRLPAAIDTAREALLLAEKAGDRRAIRALDDQLQLYARMRDGVSEAPAPD